MKQFLIFCTILVTFTACSETPSVPLQHRISKQCDYYDLTSGLCLDKRAFIASVEPYQVIFVGDHHQSYNAHKIVLTLIEGLHEAGYKVSLANEWFSPQENALLKQYSEGLLDENGSKALQWKERVGYDFNLTEPIFKAVIAEGGTLYGINLDKAFKKKISENNVSGMDFKEKQFYKALDLNVSVHKALLAPFFKHCHSHRAKESAEECAQRMYRVQVAWDTKMGEESAKLQKQLKKDEKLIVFVGTMHLESKVGVNLRFARQSYLPTVTILPYPKEQPLNEDLYLDQGSADIYYLYDED